MQVPEDQYTLETFLTYLQEHQDDIFEDSDRKRWLKVQAVLHNSDDWRGGLLRPAESRDFGEITEVQMRHADGSENAERFYAVEYQPGLLLFFTSAVQDDYQQTLDRRIRRTRGFTTAWIPPPLFQGVWQSILEEHEGFVYRFTSRRAQLDLTPARIRPEYARRFSYTGNDGTQVLKELQSEYGVTPESIYLQLKDELLVHVTNRGFIETGSTSPAAIELLRRVFASIADQLLADKRTSERIQFDVGHLQGEPDGALVAAISAGWVRFRGERLSEPVLRSFVKAAEDDFSFIDTSRSEEPLSFTATVVDEAKGSVFDIAVSEKGVSLVPRFHTTFESYLTFYRHLAEELDESAELTLFAGAQG